MGKTIEGFREQEQAGAGSYLRGCGPAEDEEGQQRGKGELGEDVPKFKGQPAGTHCVIQYPPEEEPARAFEGFSKRVVPAIALLLLAVKREGHGGAGHEHKGGLDEVPCAEAMPGMV